MGSGAERGDRLEERPKGPGAKHDESSKKHSFWAFQVRNILKTNDITTNEPNIEPNFAHPVFYNYLKINMLSMFKRSQKRTQSGPVNGCKWLNPRKASGQNAQKRTQL